MTLTTAALKTTWINAKLPQIRVAVPAMRCVPVGASSNSGNTRDQLEKQFREDFAHLSRAKAQPNPQRLSSYSAISCDDQRAA